MPSRNSTLLDARAVERTLKRMADEILELTGGTDDLVLVGIQRRGVQLADRLVDLISTSETVRVPRGALDITLYRDDLQTVGPRPVVGLPSVDAILPKRTRGRPGRWGHGSSNHPSGTSSDQTSLLRGWACPPATQILSLKT